MNDAATFASITVLVVDDEAFSLRFVGRVLGMLGVGRIIEADNGKAALDILSAGEIPIDLVITDIEMPEMDGFELARRIRYGIAPAYKDIPVLMLTGRDTDDNVKKGAIHKIDGFIVKPAKKELMETHLRRALGL